MGLVLDSSVVIAAERRGENVVQLLRRIADNFSDQQCVLSAIGVTELVHGIYRAPNPAVRSRREVFIKELISRVEIHPYSSTTALLAGRIDGEQQNRGIVIPFVDLMIGATALEMGYSIVTTNIRHFRLIPNLAVSEL